jgi:rhodanese-related sulfurtransferase
MTTNRYLAAAASLAALLAAFVDMPAPLRVSPSAHAEISALELARWIRDGRQPRVFDLREHAAFDAFSIPTAEHAIVADIATIVVTASDTVVLYSDDAAALATAMSAARTRGLTEVYSLRGGVSAWLTAVLNPALPENATPEQERAFADVAEVSRYFGGVPRRTEAVADPASIRVGEASAVETDAVVQQIRRRGC